jgi:hypothetical protein
MCNVAVLLNFLGAADANSLNLSGTVDHLPKKASYILIKYNNID